MTKYIDLTKFKNGKVFLNSLIIGLLTVAVFALVHFMMMRKAKEFSMSHTGMLLQVFISVFVFNIIAELFTLNKYYCSEHIKFGESSD